MPSKFLVDSGGDHEIRAVAGRSFTHTETPLLEAASV